MNKRWWAAAACALVLGTACSDDEPNEPDTGSVDVSVVTTGGTPDPDGYTVSINGGTPVAIPVTGQETIDDLEPGDYTVTIAGLASNCTLEGDNPRVVTVVANDDVNVTFVISCPTPVGSIRITNATTGAQLDPDGYTATVGSGTAQLLGVNEEITVGNLALGAQSVTLGGIASNCTVTGSNPVNVTVTANGTVDAAFAVNCVATTGSILVKTINNGDGDDDDGFRYSIDGGPLQIIGIFNEVLVSGLTPGSHSITLSGLAPNCTVTSANPINRTVSAGGTITAGFQVNCVEP